MPTMILIIYAHQSSETCISFPSLSKSLMAIIVRQLVCTKFKAPTPLNLADYRTFDSVFNCNGHK